MKCSFLSCCRGSGSRRIARMPESTSISQRRSGRLSQRAGGSIYSETVGRDRGERLLSRSLSGSVSLYRPGDTYLPVCTPRPRSRVSTKCRRRKSQPSRAPPPGSQLIHSAREAASVTRSYTRNRHDPGPDLTVGVLPQFPLRESGRADRPRTVFGQPEIAI